MLYLNEGLVIWKFFFCPLFLYRLGHGYSPCRGGDIPVTPWLGHLPGVGMLEVRSQGFFRLGFVKSLFV